MAGPVRRRARRHASKNGSRRSLSGARRSRTSRPTISTPRSRRLLPYDLTRRLESEAPSHFETPAGSRHALDYAAANGPLLSVRVQELYGLSQHPTLARGPRAA